MNVWSDNFLWLSALMGLLAWFAPAFFWRPKINFLMRLLICLMLSFVVLTVAGALLAIASHSAEMGWRKLMGAIASNPSGGIAYYVETGAETGAIWLPILMARFWWKVMWS